MVATVDKSFQNIGLVSNDIRDIIALRDVHEGWVFHTLADPQNDFIISFVVLRRSMM